MENICEAILDSCPHSCSSTRPWDFLGWESQPCDQTPPKCTPGEREPPLFPLYLPSSHSALLPLIKPEMALVQNILSHWGREIDLCANLEDSERPPPTPQLPFRDHNILLRAVFGEALGLRPKPPDIYFPRRSGSEKLRSVCEPGRVAGWESRVSLGGILQVNPYFAKHCLVRKQLSAACDLVLSFPHSSGSSGLLLCATAIIITMIITTLHLFSLLTSK